MRDAATEHEFLSVYDSHADSVFRLCYAKTGSRDEAKDLTQEAFMRLWERLGREDAQIENLRAFLFTIARNLIKDYYKKKKPILERDLPEGAMENVPGVSDETLQAESGILLVALKGLSDPYREALMLHLVEGISIGEIAKMLGERPNTISVRVKRGLEKARAALNIATP
jgi:RNA polymerase sigma-70 factor, ECF subfamily